MAGPTTRGLQWNGADGQLELYVNGDRVMTAFDGGGSEATTSLNIYNSEYSGYLHVAGEIQAQANIHIQSTLEAGADGVGTDGEQLTSGGAGAACDWAAAGSMRQFKKLLGIREDYDEALRLVVDTPVYDFQYKDKSEADERITTTGDTETVYTGIMADEAPYLMHHKGRILNPINTTGYLMLAIKALTAKVDALEGQLKAAQA